MSEVVMPRLSDTMEEGTILRWLKADGELLARGDELVEIETDKATMTYESDQEGVLHIIAAEGATLAVGEPIASVGGHDADAHPTAAGADSAPATPAGDGAGPAGARAPVAPSPASSSAPGDGERVRASPLARRIAGERGIPLRTIAGSGPGGRIVRADVLAAGEPSAPAPPPSAVQPPVGAAAGEPLAAPAEVSTAKGATRELELTRTQQTIARRMAESKATIPDFALSIDVDMEACVALRGELKALAASARGGPEAIEGIDTPTYNDMVVKACALAQREHPRANASYRDGRVQLHSRINVGVAVAADEALIVPTVFDADEKSLGEIARETRALAERVRAGTITPPELGGGTFTVSNLGMYGIASFTAIINPPQAAILSVGALAPRAVVRDGTVLARNTMTITLVCDHRILYGAEAAQLLARVRALLEAPAALTL